MGRYPSGRRNVECRGFQTLSSSQPSKKRHYNLLIPPVPEEIYGAIAAQVSKDAQRNQRAKLERAQQKSLLVQENLDLLQKRVKELQDRREYSRKLKQAETIKAVKQAEQEIQATLESELIEQEHQWDLERKEIEREIEVELEDIKSNLESQAIVTVDDQQSNSLESDEPSSQRSNEETSNIPRVSLDDETTRLADKIEESEEVVDEQSNSTLEQVEMPLKLSDAKKQELEECQKKADELSGMKVNMSWLLKTIIQKENEQKKKCEDQKSEGVNSSILS
jgi:hypothetical protein